MKKLFLLLLTILIAASVYTMLSSKKKTQKTPVISWRTDANPQRLEQIDLFHQYLRDHRLVNADGDPAVKLELDSANNQSTLIQAVSGTAGDILDVPDPQMYQMLGVCTDLLPAAVKDGYGYLDTYEGMRPYIYYDGEQIAFPANAAVFGWWINTDTLQKLGMAVPPEEWTPGEFEAFGKEFVKRANEGKARQDSFVTGSLDSPNGSMLLNVINRSRGCDMFNETMTACIADNPVMVETLKLMKKWTFEDRLFPTASDVASMSADSGYGGADMANLVAGKYALITTGRYCLIRIREFREKFNLSLSQLPMYEFKNLSCSGRASILYRGSNNPEAAKLYYQFLASREYNQFILAKSDGLPPKLSTVRDLLPKIKEQYPREGSVHEIEAKWMESVALPKSICRYLKPGGVDWTGSHLNRYFFDRCTAEEAAAGIQARVNADIALAVNANPALKERYEKDVKLQQSIDEYKKAGKKIPAAWVKNPFYRKYYQAKNMLEQP